MALSAESWSPDKMFAFLENPKGYMPGTMMGFAGLAKPEDRVNVIAYLATMK
jgi:cytochrome c